MGRPVKFSDEAVIAAMEEHFIRHGFTKISAVADELSMSRVYLSQRLNKMVAQGAITSEQLNEWRSPASRSRAKGTTNVRINVRLTPENYDWVMNQPNGASETINGLINMNRN